MSRVRPPSPAPESRRKSPAAARLFPFGNRARYPSGKGEVCKTFIRRFDSDPRLHILLKTQQLTSASFTGASVLVPAVVSLWWKIRWKFFTLCIRAVLWQTAALLGGG